MNIPFKKIKVEPASLSVTLVALAVLGTTKAADAQDAQLTIGAAGHSLNYFSCASEGQSCVLGEARYVAFGANGRFVFKYMSGGPCTIATFGSDPAPGIVKSCLYSSYGGPVVSEGASTYASGYVAYGANGNFNFINLGSGATFTCNNSRFGGDPAPNVVKTCYMVASPYVFKAGANEVFWVPAHTPVAYGANGIFGYYIFPTASNVICRYGDPPAVDPIPGSPVACYVVANSFLATEGQSFNAGVGQFWNTLYGSGLNGRFFRGSNQTGTCTSSTFGGDPDSGQVKFCFGGGGFIN